MDNKNLPQIFPVSI